MQLYHNVSYKMSKKLTQAYSTSFSFGIKAFAPEYRDPIYAIYGFVRIADEIVDTFHGYDKAALIQKFREDTYNAIENGISTNPVLHAFQLVVNEYKIDLEYIDAFLNSMEMDLYNSTYKRNSYDNYIYGSAEVVGLMCLKVFNKHDNEKFESLKEPARLLGSAFQKVNFLRDIKSDIEERGRIYLPNVDAEVEINDANKILLENEIQREFDEALIGIMKLPIGVKLGVYSAFLYYQRLFSKIRKCSVNELQSKRIRISNAYKFALFIKGLWEIKVLRLT
ncbi:MAG: phytoene/squalene synthase family protein [Melioribacteraceae bacterium]|nr:phytoene/squalene synthase family protein [Melioribacteraceae bacterium]WKZ68939.1 MAG: phytoene/squalene synthase family protein [Melioribacteraceae bacterium]